MDRVKEETLSTEEYVGILMDKAKQAEQRDTEKALRYALEALELATNNNLTKQEARIQVRIGRCHWINGNFDAAIEHLNEALKMSNKSQDAYAKADALVGLGNVHITMEILDQSLAYYNSALDIAEQHGFGELITKVLNNVGTLHEELKNYSVALEYYQKCLAKTEEIDDYYGTAVATLNMGNVYLALGNLEAALKYIKSAIDYGTKHEVTLYLAHSYQSMGLIYQKKKDYDQSIKYLIIGAEKASESKDSFILFRINLDLARSYDLMNCYDDAENHYQKGFEIAKQVGTDELLARIYESMALFYEKHDKDDKALKYYKAYYKANKDVKENRRKERINSIGYQSKLSISLEETKVYRQLSDELKKSYDHMHVLSEIGQSMTSTHQLDDIFDQLYKNVNLLMNAESLGVSLYDPQENTLRFNHYIEHGKKFDSFTLSLDNEKSLTVWSFLNKETLKVNDATKEYSKYIKGLGSTRGDLMHSAMYAPLMVEGEVIGVFSIQAKEKNAYTEFNKDILQTLAAYLAISIKNAAKTKQLAKLNKMLKAKSEHDGLTGIPNRRLFNERYDTLWRQAVDNQEELTVMIVDIDNFKDFNDHYGHLIGDKVIKAVAQMLSKQRRSNDDFVARYGGDEFICILPKSTKEDGELFAEVIQKALDDVNKTLDIDSKVTVSIGVATTAPGEKQLSEQLIYRADNQLYLSKANGKNRISAVRI